MGDTRDSGCSAALLALPPPSAFRPRPTPRKAGWLSASLFSGCGGLDLGFAFEGIETVAAYDRCIDSVRTHGANHRPVARRCDFVDAIPTLPDVDVLIAGPPCQGFSTNGRREIGDRRNRLLEVVDAACERSRPRVVIVENVPAALSGGHAIHWSRLEARLASMGYNVRRLHVEAEEHGVAQHRRRLMLIAWQGSDAIRIELARAPRLTLREALARLGDASDHSARPLSADSIAGRIARHIGRGQKLSNVRLGERNVSTWEIAEVFGETSHLERELLVAITRLRRRDRTRRFGDGDPVTLERLEGELRIDAIGLVAGLVERGHLRWVAGGLDHRHTYNGKYRRLDLASVSPTVDTRFSDPRLFLHPEEDRGMTIREAMRIQGFPDWFTMSGSQRSKSAMVGNAVPPPLASAVATFVRDALLKA